MYEGGSPIQVDGKNPICISFSSMVTPTTAPVLLGAVTESVNQKHDELHLLLSTGGGKVAEGVTIYNTLRALPIPVHTYNMGVVNSVGNVIFQAGERRVCATASSFMFHGIGFDVTGRMELKQLTEKTSALKNDQSIISDIIVRHTDLDTEDVNELFLNMAHMGAQEALKRGIADKVTDIHLPKGLRLRQLVFGG